MAGYVIGYLVEDIIVVFYWLRILLLCRYSEQNFGCGIVSFHFCYINTTQVLSFETGAVVLNTN